MRALEGGEDVLLAGQEEGGLGQGLLRGQLGLWRWLAGGLLGQAKPVARLLGKLKHHPLASQGSNGVGKAVTFDQTPLDADQLMVITIIYASEGSNGVGKAVTLDQTPGPAEPASNGDYYLLLLLLRSTVITIIN